MDKASVESKSSSGVNFQENARIKVSTWLSGLVEEVRKKSQGSVQKQNDTTATTKEDVPSSESEITITVTEIDTNENTNDVSNTLKLYNNEKINETKDLNKEYPSTSNNNKETKENLRKIWSKEAILTKFSQSFDKTTFEVKKASQFNIFGREKINEFYDRVRTNKIRYNLIKPQKMDTPPPLPSSQPPQTSSSPLQITEIIFHDDNEEQKSSENVENDCDTISQHKNPDDGKKGHDDVVDDDDGFLSFSHKLNLKDHNDEDERYHHSLRRASHLQNVPKNLNISHIGRSFSEANDDDDDEDLYLLNERSQSYSHVVNNRNNTNDSSSSNVSHSLPSFFDNKSPSSSNSPLLNLKMTMECGKSLSTAIPLLCPNKSTADTTRRNVLLRDSSIQSDSSHCSSVESLLESRRPDPEAILINLGFGPIESEDVLSRIPKRFLKPSQVRGIDTEAFLRRQQLANHLHDHSVLGYRGLVGNPDVPPSIIVAKIMERFEQNERKRCIMDINMNRPQSAPPTPGPNSLH